MAKPYLIFKAHTGIYYAQIRLADGSLSNNKSTGCRNRADAERIVMQWIVTGNIPVRVNSKDNKVQSIDKIRLFNDLRTADFDSDDINTIIKILTERNYLYSAVPKTSKGSIPIEDFLENFWDYDKSPYVKEKLGKKQFIHRQYCDTLLSRIRLYQIPLLDGKCVAEITRKDVDAFFSSDEAQKLSPKTVNSIIETITIPLKWAYYNELTQNNCFDGIIKCSNISKERKILDMETANKLMELDWDNDEVKIANELAMHTGMRAGEIQALTVDDLGKDEIYVRKSWSKYDGLKCCKNGEERSVPIPISHQLYLKLKMLADFNPHHNGFIFYSTVPEKPMDSKQFNKYLKRALKDIGFKTPEDICFHSWRHFFCSRMLDYFQDKRYVMALSGHKTEAMLNHYAAHLEDDKVVDLARNVMKKVFIDQKEDEETINMLNQKLEELNKASAQEMGERDMKLFGNATKKANDKDNAKIKMVEVSQLSFDRDFKNVFQQENDKVAEIANDMNTNGFDKSRPIIVTEAYIIVDGHSRFMAAKKAGLEKVPVIIKKFDSRDETIEYEYKMQLNSRRLTDGEYFAAFLKLDEIRRSNPNAQGSSDEAIGRQLNKSARQVCKMREIAKKADAALLEKIQNGSVSINKAHEMIKVAEVRKKAGEVEAPAETSSNTGKGINSDSFKLGVLFVLSELEKGRKKGQILKDKRIAKLELGELSLSEDDAVRTSQRFGIA